MHGVDYSGNQCLRIWFYSGILLQTREPRHLLCGSINICMKDRGTPLFWDWFSYSLGWSQIPLMPNLSTKIPSWENEWPKPVMKESNTHRNANRNWFPSYAICNYLALLHSTAIAAFAGARQSWVTDSNDKGQIFPHVIGGSNFPYNTSVLWSVFKRNCISF